MNINYKRLFNLNIGHDYFIDGYDRFVRLSPTSTTQTLIKNGKMLFKRLPHGITILYRATDDELTPFIQMDNKQRFIFTMTAENTSGLLNITNLDESVSRKYKTNSILYFKNDPALASDNSNNPEIITHQIIDSLRSQLFTYSFAIDGNPAIVLFRVADEDGNLVSIGKEINGTPFPTTIALGINSNNGFSQQIDLRHKPEGRYTITVLNNAATTDLKIEEIYVDDTLSKQNIIGIIDIVYESGTDRIYEETEEYRLQFHKANAIWKYYIVNKSANIDLDSDSLLITDTGSTNGTPYIINQFNRAFAGIQIEADTAGTLGNLISMAYSGGGIHPAVKLSGKTLSGGTDGITAKGNITLINNAITGYTISINGIDFTEGTHFNNGISPNDTATALASAINANVAVPVSASILGYDVTINGLPALVFNSLQAIPFFEKPKTNIELRKTSDGQSIINNLPNPAHNGVKKLFADNPESEVYVFI